MAERYNTSICSCLSVQHTHTLPNWRVPPIPQCHADDVCNSKTCQSLLGSSRDVKIASKVAQRVQRQCTGYYCGYSFKPQPVGRKYLAGAAESLSYLNTGMKDKSVGQRWHRITHRVLVDFQHRCMRRTAPEEWNLSANFHEHDPTAAEFMRTYMSVDFPGGQLMKRLEAEQKAQPMRETWKFLPGSGTTNIIETKWLQQFDDLYGFRGSNDNVFLLSPWEFLMYWEVLRLPPNGTLVSSKIPNPKPLPDRNKPFQVLYKTKT